MIPIHKLSGRLGNQMFQFAYISAQMRSGAIPDIYVQSEEYFERYKTGVKLMYADNVPENDYVVIHVRRGGNPSNPDEPNYCDNPFYVNLSKTDYYSQAMKHFPDAKFMVVSDDIEWCKGQEIFKDCVFSGGTEIEDMNLMIGSKGVIMANSSFSWWGAYLSNGKVIAPREWYTDGDVNRTKLLKEWIQI